MSLKFLLEYEYINILPDYVKWKGGEYRKTYWDIDALKNVSKETEKIVKSAEVAYSSITRERMVENLSRFSLDTLNTLTSIITIIDKTTNKTIICGFIYGKYYTPEQYEKLKGASCHDPQAIRYFSNIVSYYYNIGPSIESVDGEYRNQFADFISMFKIKHFFLELYEEILTYLKKEINVRKYEFHRETFYPTIKLKQYEENVDQHFTHFQMELNLYMMVWFLGVYGKLTNIREDHINERYINFIDKHMEKDLDFFKTLINKYTQPNMEIIYRYFANTCVPGQNYTILGFGQKLMPLNLLEVQNPFDVRFVPWKDYLVSQSLGKLVINNICPGFPIVNSWIYIKGSKKGLFNNKIQYQKIERSEQAQSIIELLIKAKSYTYQNIKLGNMKEVRGVITSWLSDKFKILHDQIDEAINFGKNEIIMSNTTFMIVSEYVGRTLHDSLKLAKSSPFYNDSIGKPFTSGGYKYFKKYIFDLLYNLHCMYEHYGIIHGDLHLNNLTLYQKFPIYGDFQKVDDPHVAYVLGDKNEYCFVLPSLSTHTTIIDFGRCFIHPDKLELLHDASIPKKYKITGNKDKFIKEQIRRLIIVYIRLVPAAKDQEQELRLLFTKNFNAMYKLMSVSDLFSVMTKLNSLFESKSLDVVSPHANCLFLIKKVIDLCQIYLISYVSRLMEDKSFGDSIEENTSPLLDIILKLFSDNLSSATTTKNIIDVFLYNNPKKYALDFVENVPDIIKIKKYMDETGKLVEFSSEGIEYNKRTRKLYEETRVKNYDIVDLIAQRHMEKIF